MQGRFGLGPVFAFEWLMASRRWQMYAVSSLLVVLLAAGLWIVWLEETRNQQVSLRSAAAVGGSFFTHLSEFNYRSCSWWRRRRPRAQSASTRPAAPLYTSWSPTSPMRRSCSANWRPASCPSSASCSRSIPVLSGAMFLGGISPEALLGAFVVELGVGVLGCRPGAWRISVWGKKTHEVLMMVYLILLLVLFAGPLVEMVNHFTTVGAPAWLEYLDPYGMAFLPYNRPALLSSASNSAFHLGAWHCPRH